MNTLKLNEKGVELSYHDGWFTSWLELRILNPTISLIVNDEEKQEQNEQVAKVDEIELTDGVA